MIIDDAISIDAYHASEYISHSKLRTFADVGAYGYHARHLVMGGPKRETTDAMRFGQAFEDFVQLPNDLFASKWREVPAVEGKADEIMVAEAAALGLIFSKRHDAKTVTLAVMRAQGVNVLSADDFKRLERMAESFTRNEDARKAIAGMDTQVTLRDDFAGLDYLPGIQARPDWYGRGSGASVDLKTCAQFGDFDRVIVGSGYHTQAALIDIITGVRNERALIACESEWPYRCQMVDLPHELLEVGARWCRRVLDEMRECYARDEWPLCATRRTMNVKPWMTGGNDGW